MPQNGPVHSACHLYNDDFCLTVFVDLLVNFRSAFAKKEEERKIEQRKKNSLTSFLFSFFCVCVCFVFFFSSVSSELYQAESGRSGTRFVTSQHTYEEEKRVSHCVRPPSPCGLDCIARVNEELKRSS